MAYELEIHCRSAFEPGASQSPQYCARLVCVLNFQGGSSVWQPHKSKTKNQWYSLRTANSRKMSLRLEMFVEMEMEILNGQYRPLFTGCG